MLIDPNFDPSSEHPINAFPPSFFQSVDLGPSDRYISRREHTVSFLWMNDFFANSLLVIPNTVNPAQKATCGV